MNLIERVKAILMTPETEWRQIAGESGDPAELFTNYVAYLAAIPAICGFIGVAIFGAPAVGVVSGLLAALFYYALTFVVVYVVALIIDALAPTFQSQKGFPGAMKLAVYSYTPAWVAGIFMMIPGLRFLTILGLYGLFLLYKGLPIIVRTPPDKALPYAGAIVGCALVVGLVIGAIRAAIFSLPGIM